MLLLLYKGLGYLTGLLFSLTVIATVDLSSEITLGSILIAFIIIAVSGVFTVRSKIATIWREEAEGERASKDRLEEILANERIERTAFERQQQEVRHELKGEIAALKAQIKVMEAKTDLSVALEAIREMHANLADQVAAATVLILKESNGMKQPGKD